MSVSVCGGGVLCEHVGMYTGADERSCATAPNSNLITSPPHPMLSPAVQFCYLTVCYTGLQHIYMSHWICSVGEGYMHIMYRALLAAHQAGIVAGVSCTPTCVSCRHKFVICSSRCVVAGVICSPGC